MIEIDDLTMDFGQLRAVDHLSLTIPRGELFAFLGPNGAGKTTTMKLLTGLLKPLSGRSLVCGIDIQLNPVAAKAKLAYVPDVAVFFDKLTSAEFMRFTADLFSLPHSQAAATQRALFDRFDLHPYARQPIEILSHGTRQRLAIAAALLHQPEVLIIDEPMVGLDPIHARTVREALQEQARSGVTVLMSTHLLHLAQEVADRVGIMHRGKLAALGTMAELQGQASDEGAGLEQIFLELVSDAPESSSTFSK